MVELQRLTPDDWSRWRTLRLEALREAPAAFGSTLAYWQGDGDTEQRWRGRLTDVPFNIMASIDGRDAGMSSGTSLDAGDVELISMWVAPFARRRGVSDALVAAVIDWARASGAARLKLAVFEDNRSAIGLYRRHGFVDRGVYAEGAGRTERLMVLDKL